ncbi:sn-glycerol-3-phosphate ABC transporter ATP-binding protein UgpC [Bosea caraganae]|uniref:sn-glycerol-3-phosphate ABC transporter ATP-binding protein UgpC n=1 Tax=Bosea caraganae TaxID=2763117 RepID=A0A370LAT2_9HYPH|nr:sn-glycerol-3-phosphate ABC transporter ATP-binding protein UgpC [Bosea caraganae]RDJ21689.1 sn-glycerol-3-phosphate ABC transporter ATP-binding protein UgpC [Bosea caraganae]RDJ28280.1 sn-glycerol-3-phosphate ABC transporter ATP-binding protein UgpC [Bosea caraganae]
MAQVNLRKVVKRFGDVEVVRGIDLTIADKEFVALVGPSGCGKSTTLRMIAGLEEISDGDILIDGKVVTDFAPKDRDIAMVFQSYALYPHMTVRENMSFGLKQQRMAKAEIDTRVDEAARILNIEDLLDRKPKALSGGQRQRVAMGRAIVRQPKVFLFDEPLSNLDAQLRVQMRTEIKRLRQKVRTTTVYVTHDQVEALTLADRIVVMNKGRIEQIGTPHELYHEPQTRFVAGFIGSPSMNFIPAAIEQRGDKLALLLKDPDLSFEIPAERHNRYAGLAGRSDLLLGLRPEHFSAAAGEPRPGHGQFETRIDITEPVGIETFVYFVLAGTEICARLPPTAGAQEGKPLRLAADLTQMHVIDPVTGLVV